MPAKPKKRKTKSVPKGRIVASIKLMSNHKPYFFVVHLWDTREGMVHTLNIPEKLTTAITFAYWNGVDAKHPQPWPDECLGEMHFACGAWSAEVIAHEVFHAMLHRGRMLPPFLGLMCHPSQDYEEHLAYEQGEWTQVLLEWLGSVDVEYGKAPRHTMNRLPKNILRKLTPKEQAGIETALRETDHQHVRGRTLARTVTRCKRRPANRACVSV